MDLPGRRAREGPFDNHALTALLNNSFGAVRWRRADRAVRCGFRKLGMSLPWLRAARVRGQPLVPQHADEQKGVTMACAEHAAPCAGRSVLDRWRRPVWG